MDGCLFKHKTKLHCVSSSHNLLLHNQHESYIIFVAKMCLFFEVRKCDFGEKDVVWPVRVADGGGRWRLGCRKHNVIWNIFRDGLSEMEKAIWLFFDVVVSGEVSC